MPRGVGERQEAGNVRRKARTQAKREALASKWLAYAREIAPEHGVAAHAIVSGDLRRKVVRAREAVWLRLMCEGYGDWQIAQASGFDHTTLLHVRRRLGVPATVRMRRERRITPLSLATHDAHEGAQAPQITS